MARYVGENGDSISWSSASERFKRVVFHFGGQSLPRSSRFLPDAGGGSVGPVKWIPQITPYVVKEHRVTS